MRRGYKKLRIDRGKKEWGLRFGKMVERWQRLQRERQGKEWNSVLLGTIRIVKGPLRCWDCSVERDQSVGGTWTLSVFPAPRCRNSALQATCKPLGHMIQSHSWEVETHTHTEWKSRACRHLNAARLQCTFIIWLFFNIITWLTTGCPALEWRGT